MEKRTLSKSDEDLLTNISSVTERFQDLNLKEKLDILLYLRWKYHKDFHEVSLKHQQSVRRKFNGVSESGGVYIVFMVDPEKNVILYAGQSKNLSKRLAAHTRLWAKTPLSMFQPNWWIKSYYIFPVTHNRTEHEKTLWKFIDDNIDAKKPCSNINEFEDRLSEFLINSQFKSNNIEPFTIQESLEPKKNFIIKGAPLSKRLNINVD